MRPYVGEIDWLDPREFQPPLGVKLFVLTAENIAIVSSWDHNGKFAAWRPMFNVPSNVKAYQRELRGYYD